MHPLSGCVAIASKVQGARLIPRSRDAFLFMLSFKQSISKQPLANMHSSEGFLYPHIHLCPGQKGPQTGKQPP